MPSHRYPVVVKCGTEFLYATKLTSGTTRPYGAHDAFDRVASESVFTQKSGTPVVIVSSGAAKEGRQRSADRLFPMRLSGKEYAGIGLPHLYGRWSHAFAKYDKNVGQILVTSANLAHGGERRSIARAIAAYHVNGVIPIINENDVIASAEQKIGDNDRLARMIAELIRADAVLFLTRVGGVYERDPAYDSRARRYKEIDARTALTNAWLTHGMAVKLLEAVQCFAMGMRVAIAGIDGDTIRRFAAGESVGTMIGDSLQFY